MSSLDILSFLSSVYSVFISHGTMFDPVLNASPVKLPKYINCMLFFVCTGWLCNYKCILCSCGIFISRLQLLVSQVRPKCVQGYPSLHPANGVKLVHYQFYDTC